MVLRVETKGCAAAFASEIVPFAAQLLTVAVSICCENDMLYIYILNESDSLVMPCILIDD